MVNTTAGTTVFGAYDPFKSIAAICEKYGIWMHVDGAWGMTAALSSKYRYLVEGVDK